MNPKSKVKSSIEPQGQQESQRNKATCDQEAWVKERIKTAINMSVAVIRTGYVGAKTDMVDRAIYGIIEGAAAEIIRTLGMEPSFINISRR